MKDCNNEKKKNAAADKKLRIKQEAKAPAPAPKDSAVTGACHICGKMGHWANKCPQRPKEAAAAATPKPAPKSPATQHVKFKPAAKSVSIHESDSDDDDDIMDDDDDDGVRSSRVVLDRNLPASIFECAATGVNKTLNTETQHRVSFTLQLPDGTTTDPYLTAVDTQSSHTIMDINLAKTLGLVIHPPVKPGVVQLADKNVVCERIGHTDAMTVTAAFTDGRAPITFEHVFEVMAVHDKSIDYHFLVGWDNIRRLFGSDALPMSFIPKNNSTKVSSKLICTEGEVQVAVTNTIEIASAHSAPTTAIITEPDTMVFEHTADAIPEEGVPVRVEISTAAELEAEYAKQRDARMHG